MQQEERMTDTFEQGEASSVTDESQNTAGKRKTRKSAAKAKPVKTEKQEEKETPELGEIFARLDQLLAQMEDEESLEQSFKLYAEGIGLIKAANDSIDRVEKQVKVLDEDGIL